MPVAEVADAFRERRGKHFDTLLADAVLPPRLLIELAGPGEPGLGKRIVEAGEVAELHGNRARSATELVSEGDDFRSGAGELAEVEAGIKFQHLAELLNSPGLAMTAIGRVGHGAGVYQAASDGGTPRNPRSE